MFLYNVSNFTYTIIIIIEYNMARTPVATKNLASDEKSPLIVTTDLQVSFIGNSCCINSNLKGYSITYLKSGLHSKSTNPEKPDVVANAHIENI